MTLYQQWLDAKQAEAEANATRKSIEQKICAAHAQEISVNLDADYGTGSATIDTEVGKFTINYPKKIDWDQDQLDHLWERITAAGENPEEYMDKKLSVSETKYKAFPSHIRDNFTPARTVSAGNPTFTFKEKK